MQVLEVDNALEYQLNQINDWHVFGSVGFRSKLSLEKLRFYFYKLIRTVERNNLGQFAVKFEGDNIARNRHFHFLLSRQGLKNENFHILKQKLNFKVKEFPNTSSDFQKFDPSLGARRYISKITSEERVNFSGAGLDSAGDSNWKLSPSLKRRLKRINSCTLESY